MAPHPLLVGAAVAVDDDHAEGVDHDDGDDQGDGPVDRLRTAVGDRLDDAARLRHLREHIAELRDRDIRFVSAFMGPVTNRIVPDTTVTRMLAPELAGRNFATAGLVSWQPVHFPDAAALAYAPDDGAPRADLYVCVVTPPRADGRVSFGPANGADGDIVGRILDRHDMALLLYVNPGAPWIDGFDFAPNGFDLRRLEPLARARRVWLVADDGPLPGLPRGRFSDASDVERRIAAHVVAHIDGHRGTTGRALQVGIGGTGAQIAGRLAATAWRGRLYTEMLDPVSFSLLDEGIVAGTHIVHRGRRHDLDDVAVSTFAMGERGSDF